ncbi:MAG: tyrosine-type recombinase/integrase [Agathobacter sp.]
MARHGENIRKRSDGRWEARLFLGKKDGKAVYRYFYGKTYKEAKEKRTQAETCEKMPLYTKSEKDMSIFLSGETQHKPHKDILFGQLLSDWLFFIKAQVKESTFAKYQFNVKRHIDPVLGAYPVDQITTAVIDNFSTEKLQKGKLTGKGGISPKTLNSLLSIIKMVLTFGQERGICSRNLIKIHNVRQTLPEILVFPKSEQDILETYLVANMCYVTLGILISLFTGLRIGEVCGLKWSDILFEEGILRVGRTVMRINDIDSNSTNKTKLMIETPKTECSKRCIPVPQFLLHFLLEYKHTPDSFLLTGTTKCMEPRNYYRCYKRILKKCGLEQYNYHALRHTFATRCIESGFDIKSLSEILGHADVNITLRRYVHPSMELKREQMERLAGSSICGQIYGQ